MNRTTTSAPWEPRAARTATRGSRRRAPPATRWRRAQCQWIQSRGACERQFLSSILYPMSCTSCRMESIHNYEQLCARDGTRLASYRTEEEGLAIIEWLRTLQPWAGTDMAHYFLGFRQHYSNSLIMSRRYWLQAPGGGHETLLWDACMAVPTLQCISRNLQKYIASTSNSDLTHHNLSDFWMLIPPESYRPWLYNFHWISMIGPRMQKISKLFKQKQ